MKRTIAAGLVVALALVAVLATTRGKAADTFSPYVDAEGNISLPKDFRTWAFLGSWHIAPKKGISDIAGAAGFHNVYTQPGTIEAYRKTGKFPDGAVLVKELLNTESGKMTTGEVNWAAETEGWFVMVKDTKGRFPDNPLWGDGWGWVLFKADNPNKTVTTGYKRDCLGCHIPARGTDWVFIQGYPVLQQETKDEKRSR